MAHPRGGGRGQPPGDKRSAVGDLVGAVCHQIETAPRTLRGQVMPLWVHVLRTLVRSQHDAGLAAQSLVQSR